ncbi:MAG: hypothetical protein IJW24_04970 [Clostridia bacterium]|nr:hypothetical protein [Clostridia bacterium]
MQNIFQKLESATGIPAARIEKLVLSHDGLIEKFTRNQNIQKNVSLIKAETELSDASFQVIFENFIQNFASIDEVQNLALMFEKEFSIEHKLSLIHALKSQMLEFSDTTTIMRQLNEVFARLNFSVHQSKLIIQKCPTLLSTCTTQIHSNIDVFVKQYKLSQSSAAKIFFAMPRLLVVQDLKRRVATIKTIFDLDLLEIESFVLNFGDLLFVSNTQITQIIKYLSEELYFSDNEIVSTLRNFPAFIKKTKDDIKAFQRLLMKKVSLSTMQVKSVLLSAPQLIRLDPKQIESVCDKLYESGLFVKLDIKKLIMSSPVVLESNLKTIAENILNISRVFELNDKKSIRSFIRECPQTIISQTLKSKLVFLNSQNIPLSSIMITPRVLNQNQNILAIKHAILSTFGLGFHLDSVLDIDFQVLVSRIKFLGLSKLSLDDVSMSMTEFERTHGSKTESADFPRSFSKLEISNLISAKSNNSCVRCLIAKMFKNDYATDLKIIANAIRKSKDQNETNSRKETIFSILETLGIEKDFARNISESIPCFVQTNNIATIIELLSLAGISREQIINLIQKRPSILTSRSMTISNELAAHSEWIKKHKFDISYFV